MDNDEHVETVYLLSKFNVGHHIEVDGTNLIKAVSKATYEEIKDYVLKGHELKIYFWLRGVK